MISPDKESGLVSENMRLRAREAELLGLLATITGSKGWRLLNAIRRLRGDRNLIRPIDPLEHTTPPSVELFDFPGSPPDDQESSDAGCASADALLERVSRLEEQLELVETHHVKGLWHALDRIAQIELAQGQIQCIVCERKGARDAFEVHRSECIFGGGILERYKCPDCDCIFGAKKFLDIDSGLVDLDYRLLYSRYREGDSGSAERRAFDALAADNRGRFINWGAGAWNDTTSTLRVQGFDVWSYEPSAPADGDFVIRREQDISPGLSGIFSNNVIEHFIDPVSQFRQFHSLLAPEGKMAHATPCYEYRYPFTRFHTVFLIGRSAEILAERTGFTVIDRIEDGEFGCVVFQKKRGS